ncbi:hypothetical protein ACIBEJ_40800 [Nonomuraea sp. NPDC050790]|uniref:hypothetical protein n=1 Tax=Nonomuraea sp. NPDC050790 TaxID=3364371 RepID=UPI0037918E1F
MTVYEVAARFPEIADLRFRSKALAMLDAVMTDEFPYFRFDARWGDGWEMASMDNGSGDAFSIVFAGEGALVRGFDHESVLSPFVADPVAVWPGVTGRAALRRDELHEAIDEIGYPDDAGPEREGRGFCLTTRTKAWPPKRRCRPTGRRLTGRRTAGPQDRRPIGPQAHRAVREWR